MGLKAVRQPGPDRNTSIFLFFWGGGENIYDVIRARGKKRWRQSAVERGETETKCSDKSLLRYVSCSVVWGQCMIRSLRVLGARAGRVARLACETSVPPLLFVLFLRVLFSFLLLFSFTLFFALLFYCYSFLYLFPFTFTFALTPFFHPLTLYPPPMLGASGVEASAQSRYRLDKIADSRASPGGHSAEQEEKARWGPARPSQLLVSRAS